ncbi:MAG: M24 family metallopeptidase [Proteobacteria bacterium]|nr:M24 family metallopeptidase [Pseudomonadota bacterium]NIS68448.1 M24 family metallopeptidase [Pseudomonadota bacterium]
METTKYELTPEGELRNRLHRFQFRLLDKKAEGALICQNADLFYFSGTIQRSFLFVPAQNDPILMTQKDYDRARRESKLKTVLPLKAVSDIPSLLRDNGCSEITRLGLELDVIPANLYVRLRELFPQAEWVDVSSEIRETRMIKSPFEIQQMKRAAAICAETMANAQRVIREGMTEIELESKLIALGRKRSHHGFMRMRGWNQEMHYGHVLSGESGIVSSFLESPTGGTGPSPATGQGASFARIKRDTPISIDLCFGVNGYIADHARTFVIGNLPRPLTDDYQKLLEVKHVFAEMAKPGVGSSDLYKAVLEKVRLEHLEDHFMGYGNEKTSFIGHGLGLEVDELPVLSPRSSHTLEEGMVFTLEPRLKYPGIGVIGFEDDYVVTASGVERITTTEDGIIAV